MNTNSCQKSFELYRTRRVQYHGLVESAGWKTKVYTLTKKGSFEAAEALKLSLANLEPWFRQTANYEFEVYYIACLIVHECDDGVFSILNWWTGEHMLQNFVYFAANNNQQQFELMSEGGLTCCVWEMAVIWHERNAWVKHVLENGDRPQIDCYLMDVLEAQYSLMNYEIRKACPTDIPEIVRLCREHAQFEGAFYCESNKIDSLNKLLFAPDQQLFCLVVESGNSVVGYTTFTRQYSTWDAESYLYLDCLYLEPGFRGIGIGQLMLRRLQTEAQKLECGHLQWQTPPSNKKAIEFYEKNGAQGQSRVRFKWSVKHTDETVAVRK